MKLGSKIDGSLFAISWNCFDLSVPTQVARVPTNYAVLLLL